MKRSKRGHRIPKNFQCRLPPSTLDKLRRMAEHHAKNSGFKPNMTLVVVKLIEEAKE